jgi:predicted regulator of Ras-like GTPase activity (Roadblock/LC7/MglB family)
MPTIAETLRMLRDVDGVHGSFVIAGTGTLVDSDLPAIFDAQVLGQIGPRIARLYETFFSGGGDMETCVLRYAEHKLYIRRMTWGIIAVLSGVAVNLPALRMVANLVIRRIDPEIAVISSLGVAPAAPSPQSPKTMPSPAPWPAAEASTRPNAPASADARAGAVFPAAIDADHSIPIVPEDGRDSSVPSNERHARMYRGRPVEG